MKVIKIILITLVILVAIVAAIGFLSPSHVHVERSLVMKAPAKIVHGQINEMKNWTNWSPWYRKDTAMKITYNSIPTGTGAGYSWDSKNKKVGTGSMTVISSNKDSISLAMNFMENGVAQANFFFTPQDSGSTKVTWTLESDMGMNPIGRVFGLFMDKMVGPDFEEGLNNLKAVAEAVPTGPKTYRGFEVQEEDAPEKIYVMKKDSMGWDKIEKFYTDNLPALLEALGKAKVEMDGAPSSLYFKWDSITKTAVMAVAVPIKGDLKTKVKGYEVISVPSGKNLHIIFQGAYGKIGTAHYAMNEYMKEKSLIQQNPVIEEYIAGPDKEADSTRWITNIYYRVK